MAEYRIRFTADTSAAGRSISDIQKAIKAVTKEFEKAEIGTQEFVDAASDLSVLNKELKDAKSSVVDLDRAYASLNKKIAAQHNAIMKFRAGMGARGAIPAVASPIRGTPQQIGSPAYFEAVDKAAKRAQKAIQEASEEARRIAPPAKAFDPYSLAAYEAKLKRLKDEARLIAPTTAPWRELTREIVKTERAIENINKRQRRGPSVEQRMGAAGGAFLYGGGLGGGIGSATLGVAGGLLGGAPGAFTGAAVGQAVDNLTSYAAAMARTVAEVNKARIALAGVTRDAQDYDVAIAAASQASKTFLLPIDQATRQFTKLQASVAGAGFETKDTQRVFNGIASAIIATGGNAEDLNGALTATAQVFSKGKVSAEELRQQIGERLPGAFTIFASSINKTPQELDKALEEGKVTLSDFMKFVDELARRYEETAKILGDAPENAGARLQVALASASLAYGGFFQQVGAGFQDYLTSLLEFAVQNERQFKAVIAIVRVAAEDFYNILAGAVEALFPVFESFFKYIFDNFSKGLNALATLAEESRRAAGGPEQRAARAVDLLYKDRPLEGHFGERRQAYEEALRVELEYDKKQEKITRDRESRVDKYIREWMTPVRPPKFGMGLGATVDREGGEAGGEERKKAKKIPFKQILDLETERRARMQASDRDRRLAELIRDAKIAGNEAEAESLNNLSKALDIQGKLRALQEYRDELINKEGQLLSNSLTKEDYNNKLQEANVKLYELSNELKKAFFDLQVKEAGAEKKAQEELDKKIQKQRELNRLIEDAQIAAGIISPREAAIKLQQREFEDAQARVEAEGSPEQLAQLKAAQALIPEAGSIQETMKTLREELDKLLSAQEMVKFSAASIGEAFSTSFKDAITGASSAQEALAGFFQSVASSFADMAAQMINKWLQMQLLGLTQSLLPGIGSFAGGAKRGQAVNMPTGIGIGAGGGILQNAGGQGFGTFGPNFGIRQFANGGLVTGPTMGLIGEGRYNEAVVPLPDGKTIPVDLGNAAGNQIVSNITVNVSNGQAQSNANGSNSSELGRKLEGAVKQVIVGELRPGGLLAR